MFTLKEIRTTKNVNQIELATILGVAQNTISSWENGTRIPDSD